jgi:hypothetical protein
MFIATEATELHDFFQASPAPIALNFNLARCPGDLLILLFQEKLFCLGMDSFILSCTHRHGRLVVV